jgi:serine/threonine protein phosphatase 1
MAQSDRFTVLRAAERIWAIGAVHGESERLAAIHDAVATDLRPGDRVVYLGNYFGYGPDPIGTLEELLRFRIWFLAHPPFQHSDDLVFLRGAQEEMFWKLLQIQFAPDPAEILEWMAERGIASLLTALDFKLSEGLDRAAEGTLALTYWTNRLRERVRSLPGYDALIGALKRAAYTENGSLLFVHAGLDPEKPLARQADALWWAARGFAEMDRPYRGFRRVVRGYAPGPAGIEEGEFTLSLDAGAGRGGDLAAVLLDADGEVLDRLTA